MSVIAKIHDDTNAASVAGWKTYLAAQAQNNTPVQILAELETPLTLSVTPTDILMSAGTNKLWANSGDLSLHVIDDDRQVTLLTEMPLTVSVTGAGAGGTTTVSVTRLDDYHSDRPDDTDYNGFKGESILTDSISGNGTIAFDVDDLIGTLDDGAQYLLSATVKDSYGQTDTDTIEFEVKWNHQASAPRGLVEIDYDKLIAELTPIAPTGAVASDTCDIYRLSADMPELLVKGATFGQKYVDPYPAIGGGYRFVTKTKNGDYITEDNEFAWVDIDSEFEFDRSIIDFDGRQVLLYYNLDFSNEWEKDFQATRYLGGSIVGDWKAGVIRTATVNTVAFTEFDAEVIEGMRRLADYAGICHIRTLDGSSFSADLQVNEDRDHADFGTKASFSISATRIDPEEPDGVTYTQWSEGDELE